jgi:uncharacterized membrane protein
LNTVWLHFDHPQYLWLFALLPVFWWMSRASFSGLSRGQAALALAVRTLVFTLIVLALADAHSVRSNNRLTVLYLLDQSHSIPDTQREAMIDFVNASIDTHRQEDSEDRVGVMVFGRQAEMEIPPLDVFPALGRIQSPVDPEYTDLAAALSHARGMFPGDSAGRVVLVTDGNENLGDSVAEAKALSDAGISIDVVPVPLPPRAEVAVEKVMLPAVVRDGEPFELRTVLSVDSPAGNASATGTVRVVRKAFGQEETIVEQAVELPPGKTVLSFDDKLDRSGFFTYEAHFSPSKTVDDGTARNNMATAFTQIVGSGQVLLIENAEEPGAHDHLVEVLRRGGMEVEVATTSALFTSLAELQRFDCVVLADVPLASGGVSDDVSAFTEAQLRMLVENTETLGCGLVVIGGPNSYGAGGWANSELEKALPVDCQIKDARVVPVGALGLVIDRSGSMMGEKMQLSKAAAIAAVRSLGNRDMLSVVAFDSTPVPVCRLQQIGNGDRVAAAISRLTADGGTDMYPAFAQVVADMEKAQAAVKHIIVLTDGQTPPQPFDELVRRARAAKVTVSAVAVGGDAQVPLLTNIAAAGGGRFYAVRNPKAVPRIFMREARRVSRPLVRDLVPPQSPQIVGDSQIVAGLEGAIPPIRGFVMTTVKESPLVEVIMRSPVPPNPENSTILASWNYGLGKVVAFTSDAGQRWTNSWTSWDGYEPLFTKMVRSAMRPTDGSRNYSLATTTANGVTTVVIDALDNEDEILNSSTGMMASVLGPDSKSTPLTIDQVAPGRYVGRFDSRDAGTYLLAVSPSDGPMLRTGVSVGYSREYRDREANLPLLETLAGLTPEGGEPGHLAGGANPQPLDKAAEQIATAATDPFRHDLPRATAIDSIWPWLVVAAACLFVGDVGVRRIRVSMATMSAAVSAAMARVFGRRTVDEAPATLSRLQTRKQTMRDEYATRRVEVEPLSPEAAQQPAPTDWLTPPPAKPSARGTKLSGGADVEAPPEESYTERLLRAKRDATRGK